VSIIVTGTVGAESEPLDVCTSGEGGQRYVDRDIDLVEWLQGDDHDEPLRIRTLTHLLRLDCQTGLPSGYLTLETGRTYLLFLLRGALPGLAGSRDQPDFVLADHYLGAWLLDGDELFSVDPRIDAVQTRYDASDALAALKNS
jgi:hypothetical protein